MSLIKKILVTTGLVFALGACSSVPEQQTPQNVGFLSDYSKLEYVDMGDDSVTWKYKSPIDTSKYDSIIIDEIDFYPTRPNDKQIPAKTLKDIKGFVGSNVYAIFSSQLKLTDDAGPNTARLKLAITGLNVDDKELEFYEYIPIAFVINAFQGELNDMSVKIQIDAELIDSQTRDVISAFTKKDAGKVLENDETPLSFKNLEPLLKKWLTSLDGVVNK